MKTCNVLASALFGTLAVAAPLRQRALHTTTVTILETVTQYTTVWDGEAKTAPPPASTPAYFFENQAKPTTTQAAPAYTPTPVKPSSSSVYTPAPAPPSSSAKAPEYTPAPQPSSAALAPSSKAPEYTPAPQPSSAALAPSSKAPEYTPAPVSSAAPAPSPSAPATNPGSGSGTGQIYDTKMTVYDITPGAYGACSEVVSDDMPIVALESNMMGASTYDSNGKSTNPYCGRKIIIDYNGKKTIATIKDKCPGCDPNGIDLTRSLWATVVGPNDPGSRLPVKWQFA